MKSSSPFITFLISCGIAVISNLIAAQYIEMRADDLAITHSSIEELKKAKEFFIDIQNYNLEMKKAGKTKAFMISDTGENWQDTRHPSLKSRIKKIDNALLQRTGLHQLYHKLYHNELNITDLFWVPMKYVLDFGFPRFLKMKKQ
jgi:hypothetical protein